MARPRRSRITCDNGISPPELFQRAHRALVPQYLQPRALDHEKLRGLRLSRAAELVEMAVEETLAYYAFPEEHWRRIRTNNPLAHPARDPAAHPRRGRLS